MKLKALSKREKIIFSITLAILFFGLSFAFVLVPVLDKISTMDEEIAAKKKLYEKYSNLINKGGDILSLYEGYKDTLQADAGHGDIDELLFNDINGLAKKSGLAIERIKLQPIEEKKGYRQASLEVEMGGDLNTFFQFINELENLSVFIKMSALRIVPQTGSSSGLRFRIMLSRISFVKNSTK